MRVASSGFRVALAGAILAFGCGSEEEAPAADPVAAPTRPTAPAGSGLGYTELVAGSGESPSRESTVTVHYHGTFPDGKVFDSSIERGKPARFRLDRVIPCWTEALQRMRVGGKANLVCPPEIAYGARGGGPIPPNATLHFEVELLGVR